MIGAFPQATAIGIGICLILIGAAVGWAARSALDRALDRLIIKILASKAGRQVVAEGLTEFLARQPGQSK